MNINLLSDLLTFSVAPQLDKKNETLMVRLPQN